MARIRSVKPQLRTSFTVAEWPREVRYFWVLLWGYLDDRGRGIDDPRLIKSDCFPLDDDVTGTVVDDWIALIAKTPEENSDLPTLCRYQVRGRNYVHAPKWTDHQKPQYVKESELPECPLHESLENPEDSQNGSEENIKKILPVVVVGEGVGEVEGEGVGARPPDASRASAHEATEKSATVVASPAAMLDRQGTPVDLESPANAGLGSLGPPLQMQAGVERSSGGPKSSGPQGPANPGLLGTLAASGPSSAEVQNGEPKTASKGTRLPEDFKVTDAMVKWAAENAPNVNGRRETERFCNYWWSKAGRDATKVKWDLAWRNWMLKEQSDAERFGSRASPGPKPSTTDQRVNDALALGKKLQAEADAQKAIAA